MAVVCATAFFIHEYIPIYDLEYNKALEKHQYQKKLRTIALDNVKQSTLGQKVYLDYLVEKEKTDEAWENFQKIQEKKSFLGFINFQQFLGEFGWALGLFIYSLLNLLIGYSSYSKMKNAEKFLHSTLLFVSIYFLLWTIQQWFPDFPRYIYLVFSFFIVLMIVFSIRLVLIKRESYLNSLKGIVVDVFHFLYKDAKEKNFIKEEKESEFRKIRFELTNKVIENE